MFSQGHRKKAVTKLKFAIEMSFCSSIFRSIQNRKKNTMNPSALAMRVEINFLMMCYKNPLKFSTNFHVCVPSTEQWFHTCSKITRKHNIHRAARCMGCVTRTNAIHDAVIIQFIVLIQIANKAFPICSLLAWLLFTSISLALAPFSLSLFYGASMTLPI